MTLNIGEKPREPNPTKLSQLLETETDPKYRLSAKACQGILNRAERRGKELPKELKEALEEQVLTNSGQQEIRDGARLEMDGTEILPPEPMSQEPLTETTTKVPENVGALSGKLSLNEPLSPSRNEPVNLGGVRESSSRANTSEPCQRSTTSPSSSLAAAFSGGMGAKAGNIGYQEEMCPSLKSSESGTNTVPDILLSTENE